MFVQQLVLLALTTLAFTRTLPLAERDGPPKRWWSGLENYNTYHSRYMGLDCENRHGTSFFTSCCHPRLKNADLSEIPDECLGSDDICNDGDSSPQNVEPTPPASSSSSASTHSPTSKPSGGGGGGDGNGNGKVIKGTGDGTYFLQNGVAGACGTVHPDSAKIVALDSSLYGDTGEVSQYCGKTVVITNVENGKSVTATVADACPTCDSWGSIDMSVGAFTEIATEEQGEVKIKWTMYL